MVQGDTSQHTPTPHLQPVSRQSLIRGLRGVQIKFPVPTPVQARTLASAKVKVTCVYMLVRVCVWQREWMVVVFGV